MIVKQAMFAYVNHPLIHSWNLPVLIDCYTPGTLANECYTPGTLANESYTPGTLANECYTQEH